MEWALIVMLWTMMGLCAWQQMEILSLKDDLVALQYQTAKLELMQEASKLDEAVKKGESVCF